jgi:hypothetical protein
MRTFDRHPRLRVDHLPGDPLPIEQVRDDAAECGRRETDRQQRK